MASGFSGFTGRNAMNQQTPSAPLPLTVVFASDGGYVPYLLVVVSSVLRQAAGRSCDIVVLTMKLTPLQRECLEAVVAAYDSARLRIIDGSFLDERLAELFRRRAGKGTVTSWSYSAYYRLFIGSLLPDCRRALYLDVDTLACRNLAGLFDIDMGGHTVACAEDTCLIEAPGSEELRSRLRANGHDVERYFNSGVVLIDLDRWRARNAEDALLQTLLHQKDLFFPDQDALNIVFREDRVLLPCRWNFLTCRFLDAGLPDRIVRETAEVVATGGPGVIHYVGGKPWAGCGEAPLAHLWWREAERVRTLLSPIAGAEALRERLTRRNAGRKLASLRFQQAWLSLKIAFAGGERQLRLRERRERARVRIRELLLYRE